MKSSSKIYFKLLIIFIALFSLNIKNIEAKEIPKIYLIGDIEDMNSKKDIREFKLTYKSKKISFDAYATLKIQGATSKTYDKKNYTIKLYKDKNYTTKKKIDIGYGKESKYCLKANWVDKTHSRNIVTARIVSKIQKKYHLFENTPNYGVIDGFPIELYINNKFHGLYTLNIPKDEWLYNMDKNNSNHIAMFANDYNDSIRFKEEATKNNWEIEIGPKTEKTIEKFNRLLNFIKDSSDTDFKNNFHKYLDIDSTLNYYIMTNFANLADNINKNILLITYDGKIWYPTLYDLDTSWGTNWNGISLLDYKSLLKEDYENSLLWSKFEKNFSKEIADRYFELRKDILTKENILKQFNDFYNSIPKETFNKEQNKWIDIPGYDINQIEEFLNTRIPITDKNIYNFYTEPAQISINYSTKKPTIKPVTINLIPNRKDIIIIKDGVKTHNYSYTFKENGIYTLEYQDWFGNNIGSITIEIDNIKTQTLINVLLSLLISIIGLILFIITKKKRTTITAKEKIKTNKKKVQKNKNNNETSKKKKKTNKNYTDIQS